MDTPIVYKGTQGEIYDAMHSSGYRQIIEYYFKWKRGLYQLPPYHDAPYQITEAFNLMAAYDRD